MANNEYLGSALYASFVYSGGTVVLSGEQRSFTYTPSIDFIEAQAGSDATRRRLAYLKDFTATFEWTAQTDGTVIITALTEGTSGTLNIGDAGSASGRPKLILPVYSQGITRTAPYNDVVMYSATFLANGDASVTAW